VLSAKLRLGELAHVMDRLEPSQPVGARSVIIDHESDDAPSCARRRGEI